VWCLCLGSPEAGEAHIDRFPSSTCHEMDAELLWAAKGPQVLRQRKRQPIDMAGA
jgi:hypothetical protein